VANHRDGGRDPTELALTVQPANTARPVETTKTIIPQPVMGGYFESLAFFLWSLTALRGCDTFEWHWENEEERLCVV